ncbi:MAG: arginine--tRNA ligase [Kiloniellales bacterium]|nr:arginine--tRNA ligase [Kiloniellales bacterium]
MNLFRTFKDLIAAEVEDLARAGTLPAGLDTARVTVEPPREASHGDLATNAAMVLAKPAGMKPRDLAALLAARLEGQEAVRAVEIAGPGFINLRLTEDYLRARLVDVLTAGTGYGDAGLGRGVKVNVEYVSANPTGPLHIAHARGAVIGDALAALLEKVGYDVTREYYINDAGAQVDVLARSLHLRYREALGEDVGEIPEGYYPGDYLKQVGGDLAARDGDKWLGTAEAEWLAPLRDVAIAAMLDLIRDDLKDLGVEQEVFTSERALVEAGRVEEAYRILEAQGLIYVGTLEPPKGKPVEDWEAVPLTLFKATRFGDDVDRPIKKSDGSWTYFAPDMAYHLDKFRRGFTVMVDVFGADHAGHVKRLKAGVTALTRGKAALDIRLCQLVTLLRGGKPVRMSKRAGSFVTLKEVIDEVGKGVVRFIMLTRRNDVPLDFDLEQVLEQSRENPVFYVHYAHARCCSVLRSAKAEFPGIDLDLGALAAGPLHRLTDSGELGLIKQLTSWPRIVEGAAESFEPHRIAFYLYDLAAAFHSHWNRGNDNAQLRFLLAADRELTAARLALVQAVALVIASGLQIMGVEPVEELR